jgi:hypothetical protein
MNNRAHWLVGSLGGVVVGALLFIGGVWAQEAPAYGGPYISNPGTATLEGFKRQERVREAYCRKQPGGCPPSGKSFTQEQLKEQEEATRYRGPYVPPEPGHLTDCHPDPNNPEKPICVHE